METVAAVAARGGPGSGSGRRSGRQLARARRSSSVTPSSSAVIRSSVVTSYGPARGLGDVQRVEPVVGEEQRGGRQRRRLLGRDHQRADVVVLGVRPQRPLDAGQAAVELVDAGLRPAARWQSARRPRVGPPRAACRTSWIAASRAAPAAAARLDRPRSTSRPASGARAPADRESSAVIAARRRGRPTDGLERRRTDGRGHGAPRSGEDGPMGWSASDGRRAGR